MLNYKRTISVIIISFFLVSFFSYLNIPSAKALDGGAGWANFAQYSLKEFVLDTASRVISRLQMNASLKGIAQQVVQSGRTGRTPSFIQNWRNLMTDGQYRGEDIFRTVMGNTAQCPYFRSQILNTFGVRNTSAIPGTTQNLRVNNLDPFTLRGKCTMPQAWNIQNYERDFSGNGGWDALVRLSQPQNNFYGSMLISLNELNVQRGLESRADIYEGTSGSGYLGVRKSGLNGTSCDTPPSNRNACLTCVNDTASAGGESSKWCFSNDSCVLSSDDTCRSSTETPAGCNLDTRPVNSLARCTFLGSVATPGDILGKGAAQFIDKNLGWLTTSDEVSEVLGNFINSMIDKLVNFSTNSLIGAVQEPQRTDYTACIRQCNNTSSGSQNTTCIENCYKGAGVDVPTCASGGNCDVPAVPPPLPPPPPTLPASLPGVTVCSDGGAPSTNNVCLSAQWFRQGMEPNGLCPTSNCVLFNHHIHDGSTDANIYSNNTVIYALFGASDYPNGTRAYTCSTEGNKLFGLATTLTPGITFNYTIPVGGGGNCTAGGGPGDIGPGGGPPPVI